MSTKTRSRTRTIVALVLVAVLIVLVGVALMTASTVQTAGDQFMDAAHTRAAGAAQTAVHEFNLAQRASP